MDAKYYSSEFSLKACYSATDSGRSRKAGRAPQYRTVMSLNKCRAMRSCAVTGD